MTTNTRTAKTFSPKVSGVIKKVFYLLALAALLIFAAGPLLWMILSSVRPAAELFHSPPSLIPSALSWEWYVEIFERSQVALWFTNSFVIAAATTVLSLVLGTLGGYALSRFVFAGKKAFMGTLLLSYLFPAILLLLPMYMLMSVLGIIGTHVGVVLAHLVITLPLSTFLMKSFADSVPKEIEEASLVDGAGRWRTFFVISLPLMRTGLATVAIFAFILSWDEYLFSSAIAQGDAVTLPVALEGFVTSFDIRWGAIMALSTVITLPIIIMFSILQKYFEKGLTSGSVK